jgi:hypothetical protein
MSADVCDQSSSSVYQVLTLLLLLLLLLSFRHSFPAVAFSHSPRDTATISSAALRPAFIHIHTVILQTSYCHIPALFQKPSAIC